MVVEAWYHGNHALTTLRERDHSRVTAVSFGLPTATAAPRGEGGLSITQLRFYFFQNSYNINEILGGCTTNLLDNFRIFWLKKSANPPREGCFLCFCKLRLPLKQVFKFASGQPYTPDIMIYILYT